MAKIEIVAVEEGSAAKLAGIQSGDELININGLVPRDILEYRQLIDSSNVAIEIRRKGESHQVEVERDFNELVGMEVSSSVFDKVRTCDNHCEFCFIYQLPKGMRKSLYQKDDDYRLSFLYGNFTTLTRFTESDFERVVTEGLSPLFVSIHATDPHVRADMLRNKRGAVSLRWLRHLLANGIEVHGQVVVCPGVNDGAVLEDTLASVLEHYSQLKSLALVPLGVSDYTPESSSRMRPHTKQEAEAIIDLTLEWQEIFNRTLAHPMVYASDEYFLIAMREFPNADIYRCSEQIENGVGLSSNFIKEWQGQNENLHSYKSGFFQWVDGAPNGSYRPKLFPGTSLEDSREKLKVSSGRIKVLTGEYGKSILEPLVADLNLKLVDICAIKNEYFGGNIGVAGLLTGEDINKTLDKYSDDDVFLLPDVCLNEGRFLDGMSTDGLSKSVVIVPTSGYQLRKTLDYLVSETI
ncbi:MAG: DUF512 domain-containing protein [Acidimicrobiales bacterium]|nr:DUF512 domain-containing protein [Acidimicrobiales bacterium]